MTTHSMLVQELFAEGDAWRITIRELSSASLLAQELFPYGPPYGVTIAEDIIIEEPSVVGSFLIRGIDSDTLPHMAEDYAQRFRDAGLTPYHTSLAGEGAPEQGMVRTWLQGIDEPWDMPEDEAASLYIDNWSGVDLPTSLTVWDPIDTQTVTFTYANGMTYPITLNLIEQSQTPADRLLNHSNYLVIPADGSLNPVLSARTAPNMFALRVVLNAKDQEIKAQQLEIGDAVVQFANAIKDLANGGTWSNPVDVFRAGLGKG